MPQWELGCVIALPLGNLLNKYLAKQPRGNNSSISLIAVLYRSLVPTLTAESGEKNTWLLSIERLKIKFLLSVFFGQYSAKELHVFFVVFF